jgi:hypothetical protein
MNDIVNKKEIRIFAIKRSGQHAFMQWLANNCGGEAVVINKAKLYQNIYLNTGDSHFFKNNKLLRLNVERERRGLFSEKDFLIYNQESADLDAFNWEEFFDAHDKNMGRSLDRYTLILLRDPFNLMASHLRRYERSPLSHRSELYFNNVISLWKQYAKEYLGETSFIPGDKILVDFDRWGQDEAYRSSILDALSIPYDNRDNRIDHVLGFGAGSSFDDRKMHGKASKMKVGERWKEYKKNSLYRSFFDEEIVELSQRIFADLNFEGTDFAKRISLIDVWKAKAESLFLNIKFWFPLDGKKKVQRRALALAIVSIKMPNLYAYLKGIKDKIMKIGHK